MDNPDKFIFTYVDEDREGIFSDLTNTDGRKQIDFLLSHKRYNNKILNQFEKICLSYKLNKKFYVPFQTLFYNLDSYKFKDEYNYHIIVPTTSISKFSSKYLTNFKSKHPNVFLYALVTDSMHANSPHMDLVRDKLFSNVWEKVLTYDKYDAAEFGFTWFGYTYYSSFNNVNPDIEESDLYYVGYDKGNRDKTVSNIYQQAIQHNISARFDVVSNKKNNENGLVYLSAKISYLDVIARAKSSNCILEILQENQETQSLRYFEAIAYNKKLLSNNKNIFELPFYNEKYMKYINSINDIDWNWVKTKEEINYGYSGEFSPINLIKFINSIKR